MTVIAFATYEDSGGFTSDDHQLVIALRERGVEVEPVVWDDTHIDWRRFPLVVIRSVWDCHLKANRFSPADCAPAPVAAWVGAHQSTKLQTPHDPRPLLRLITRFIWFKLVASF
jgi:hypothetical protein